jgi:acetylornithine deacetylase
VIVAAVVDEEYESLGTRALLASGVRADAAVSAEPTRLAVCPAHRGFVWTETTFRGRAAHGSRYDVGIDAIRHAALVLAELDSWEREVLVGRTHPLLGRASLHASTISGGVGMSTYPERCVLAVERRTIPGETAEAAVGEVEAACARVRERVPELDAAVRLLTAQGPSDVSADAPLVRALLGAMGGRGLPARIEGMSAWTDCALLNDAGVPAVCFGPGDIALAHAAEEWVPAAEIETAADVLADFVAAWCGGRTSGRTSAA